jgi:hypothetical protein
MPVPQKFNFLVEWASCPLLKSSIFLWNGHPARCSKTDYQLPTTHYQLPIIIPKFKIHEQEYIDRTIRKIPKYDSKS